MRKDPPLNALRAFEAAGRVLSISEAAQELNVTPAAVSHQIKALEDFLRVGLFVRGHRTVTLTPAGAQYLSEISKHLTGIRRSTARVMESCGRRRLRIQVPATIAMRWLVPRLSSFHTEYPTIDVSLTTSVKSTEFDYSEFDGAVRLGKGEWPGLDSFKLVVNELCPVCRPNFLNTSELVNFEESLASTTLLHSVTRPDDWSHWLEAAGISNIDPYQGLRYDTSVLAYQAAIEGHGVAISQKILVFKDIADGRLIHPYNYTLDMGSYTYYFAFPSGNNSSKELEIFCGWLEQQSIGY